MRVIKKVINTTGDNAPYDNANDDDEGGGLLPADLADGGRHAEDSDEDKVPLTLLFPETLGYTLTTYQCHACA